MRVTDFPTSSPWSSGHLLANANLTHAHTYLHACMLGLPWQYCIPWRREAHMQLRVIVVSGINVRVRAFEAFQSQMSINHRCRRAHRDPNPRTVLYRCLAAMVQSKSQIYNIPCIIFLDDQQEQASPLQANAVCSSRHIFVFQKFSALAQSRTQQAAPPTTVSHSLSSSNRMPISFIWCWQTCAMA